MQPPKPRFYDFAAPQTDGDNVRQSSLSPPQNGHTELPNVDIDYEEQQSQTQLQTQIDPEVEQTIIRQRTHNMWGRFVPCSPHQGPELVFDFRKLSYTIGRAKNADFTVASPKVSGTHCIVTYDPENNVVVIQDLSSNGTYVSLHMHFMVSLLTSPSPRYRSMVSRCRKGVPKCCTGLPRFLWDDQARWGQKTGGSYFALLINLRYVDILYILRTSGGRFTDTVNTAGNWWWFMDRLAAARGSRQGRLWDGQSNP